MKSLQDSSFEGRIRNPTATDATIKNEYVARMRKIQDSHETREDQVALGRCATIPAVATCM